jgi:hypothetical protein
MSPEQREEKARFRQEVRARISLIATERGLPKAETAKVMGRLATRDVIDFICSPSHRRQLAALRRPERACSGWSVIGRTRRTCSSSTGRRASQPRPHDDAIRAAPLRAGRPVHASSLICCCGYLWKTG